jgi:hypothetical protein
VGEGCDAFWTGGLQHSSLLLPSLADGICRRVGTVEADFLASVQAYPAEGAWGSLMIAEIGECMVNLEEEGVEAEHIPEAAQVKLKLQSMST